jgi:hypothetical protein
MKNEALNRFREASQDLANAFPGWVCPIPVKEQQMSGLAMPSANRGRLCGNRRFDLSVALQDLR